MRTLLISLLWVLGGVEETVAVPAVGRHATREFYIAAVEIGWDYLYWGSADSSEQRRRTKDPPQKYIKAVYREYTDSTYSVPKPTSTWAGIQGPVIHAQASDRVVVHFKNLASQPYSISPVGVSYWKQSEGAGYDDATSSQEKEDDAVAPGGYYKYVWDINPNDGPTVGDPECLTYSYSSQVDTVQDFNSGLIGALLICKSIRKSREFILLFAVFDESKSWYGEVGSFRERFKKASARKQYHTINGYVNSTLPGLTMCQGRDHVFWHLIGMETSPEIHSIQFQDHTLQVHLSLTLPFTQGKFLISCQIQANSHGKKPVTVPGPDVRRVQQSENEEDYEYGDDMFELFVFKPVKSRAVGRSRGGKNKVWVHYIAAEEISWDYAPHLSQGDSQLLSEYFPRGPHQLGHEYKKVVYVEYTDQTFTKRKSPVKRLLGPLLRGQVDEHFQIVFKNLASRPFNMYPTGLTRISPLRKTENEGEKDLRSLAVPPNGTYGYVWKLTAEDGPLEGDPQCLTRLYQSTINPERDLATGLIGPLLICKKDSMDTRGRLVGPDKVKQLMFAVFDENKSWYINDNIQKYSKDPSMVQQQREEQKVEVLDQLKVEEQKAGDVHPLSNNTHTELDTPLLDLLDLDFSNVSNDNKTAPRNAVSLEYDDYSEEDTGTAYIGTEDNLDLRTTDGQYRSYYIAAQEITWDYGIRKPHQERRRGMRKFLAEYKKVVFRAFSDRDFQIPVTRGELQEHLGLMGPIIKAEVNDLLTVTFKNMASRPYSLHLHGVYDKSQGDGQSSGAGVAGVPGEAVQPGEVRVYTWRITRKQGPTAAEFDCKAGAYYSTQNKEKDLHSGLIGPLVICKPGTLHPQLNLQPNLQEYALLFHTFDETKSWYLDENIRRYCTPPCQAQKDDPWFQLSNKFAAINGYVAETLPGLMVAQHQQVRWHLLNVGGDGEYHTAHFHGLPFSIHKEQEHRMGVYNLYPGVFGTVEMRPATVGTWMVECTVGEHQLAGMRAKLLVYNPRCIQPLGLRSGRIDDSQITASDHIGKQASAMQECNHKNVDLQRPTLIHGIQTQGARASLGLKDYFIMYFTLSYSLDQETWTNYRGNSTTPTYIFNGNLDGSKVKENHLSPPILGRYIRLQPVTIQRNPALRMELLGCDVNSCSFPLGLQRRLVPDSSFRASSFLQTWRLSWGPALARLHQDGSANAWRPKANNPHEWLQVDFLVIKRITGVITQGAWSILTQMMVTEFSVTISDNGNSWSNVMFLGNIEPDEEMLNLFDPPLFARFIRIHPRGWLNDIALRLEFMGCDTQQRH
uniref:Coagulation factor VIII, procoagulant component n=1 Tax=Oncorhynchus mykiss TaxID=8022 RepID=A0A8C7QYX6_ONCMY